MATLDPDLSLIVMLSVGWMFAMVAQVLRLPRVIGMIFAGVLLTPVLSSGVLTACSTVPNAANPASTFRTFALLIALARGAFGLEWSGISRMKATVFVLAFVPYFAEMLVEAAVARAVLPDDSGINSSAPTILAYLAAALWAALSPSLVIPNMLALIEGFEGRVPTADAPPYLVLCAAPLEVAAALVTFGAINASAQAAGGASAAGFVPLFLAASVLLGIVLAAALKLWRQARDHPLAVRHLGAASQTEQLVAFVAVYLTSYALCTPYAIPQLTGTISALSCVLAVRGLSPELTAVAAPPLKAVWSYAEVMLFVLTGVIIRGAIDSGSSALGGEFVLVLLCGLLTRAACDIGVGALWQLQHEHVKGASAAAGGDVSEQPQDDDAAGAAGGSGGGARAGMVLSRSLLGGGSGRLAGRLDWRQALARAAFAWACTTPKATVQAALGGAPLAAHAALGISVATGSFIQQSAAVSILYCATAGSLLTHTLGRWLLRTAFADSFELPRQQQQQGAGGDGLKGHDIDDAFYRAAVIAVENPAAIAGGGPPESWPGRAR